MTAAAHADALAAALSALEIRSRTSYAWLGEEFHLPEPVRRHAPPDGLRSALEQAISLRLYGSFFTAGKPVPAARPPARRGLRRALSGALDAANCGRGCVDPGWRLVAREGDRWVVERRALRLWPRRDEVVADGPGAPAIGEVVAVRLPKGVPEMSPGFYMALGDRGFSAKVPRTLDRYYLNVREDGALDFVRLATSRLNVMDLAFRAKVIDEPGAFGRCDAALLAFERRDRPRAVAAVLALGEELADALDPETPALTRRLAPGLAFAEEDPGQEESFGVLRCRMVAEALVGAHERGIDDLPGRLAAVKERFARAGTSLDAPHLAAGSTGDLDDLLPPHLQPKELAPCR